MMLDFIGSVITVLLSGVAAGIWLSIVYKVFMFINF